MPPKRKLSDQLSKRFTTEEKVEVQDQLAAATASISKDTNIQERTREGTQASVDTSMPARDQESKDACMHTRQMSYTKVDMKESRRVRKHPRKHTWAKE